MRHAIRLLSVVVLVLFGAAIVAAIRGEQAVAAGVGHEWEWPGLVEQLLVFALLGLVALVFIIMTTFGLTMARQRREWPWVITFALIAVGIGTVYLGLAPPLGFLGTFVHPFLPQSGYRALLLLFIPVLVGTVPLVIYSYQTQSASRRSLG
jgi:cytochrome bd-type quinol oxidase subunit 2